MRETWRRLGRDDAINRIVIVCVVALQFAGSFVTATVAIGGREWLFAACSAVSVAAVALVFLGGRRLIVLLPQRARPAAVLTVFQGAAIVRAVVFDGLLLQLDFIATSELGWRIYGSQSNVFVCAIIVSSLVTMARDYSERNRALQASLHDLQAQQEDLEARAGQRRRALIESIRGQFEAAIARMSGVNRADDSVQLRSLIDDVVRPLSHRLGRGFTAFNDTRAVTHDSRINWSSVISRTLDSNPVHPVWFTVWITVVAVQLIVAVAGSAFIGPLLIAAAFVGLWFSGLHALWPRLARRLNRAGRGVLFTVAIVASAPPLNATAQALTGLPFVDARLVVAQALYFAVICWAITVAMAVRALLRETNAELTAATAALSRRLVTENLTLRHFEAGVSRVLHGPVQDAVAASLRRLQSLTSHELSADELAAIRQPIVAALALLDEPETRREDIATRLADLITLWSGVVEIHLDVDPTRLETLRSDPTTASAVLELVREAVSNAIRHGDARQITVTLDATERDVAVTVTNDGRPVPDGAAPGIGTQLLTELSLEWSRENTGDGVRVRATVPLARANDGGAVRQNGPSVDTVGLTGFEPATP